MCANARNRGNAMASKRPVILMAILLVLLGAFFGRPRLQDALSANGMLGASKPTSAAPEPAVLPGATKVSNLAVTQQPDGRWMISLDYFYTGEPKGAVVEVYQVVTGDSNDPALRNQLAAATSAQRGAQRFTYELRNPRPWQMSVTTQLYALVRSRVPASPPHVARAELNQRIQWPDPAVVEVEKAIASGEVASIIEKAVSQIDTGKLQEARVLLQALVERKPDTEMAYVELARVAMKSNWGPEGLREAEALIRSALQISPESANAKILLGYVLAHQGRHRDAEPLFVQAAASNPPNLYLWANWGELLAMQGKKEAAISKYREAITRPPPKNTYDRARQDAFRNLLRLMDGANPNALEALHQQRVQEYPDTGCYSVDYARFLALDRADPDRAIATLRAAPAPQCDPARGREVQGLAHYLTWSRAQEAERLPSLLRARALLPSGPRLFYVLASSEKTTAVAKQLLAAGDKLDAQADDGYDALGYALYAGDTATARRLLRLGARPAAEIGPERMPAALIPVLKRDLESIRLLQSAGVDYTKLKYRGMTGIEHARSLGDNKLLLLLDPKAGRV